MEYCGKHDCVYAEGSQCFGCQTASAEKPVDETAPAQSVDLKQVEKDFIDRFTAELRKVFRM